MTNLQIKKDLISFHGREEIKNKYLSRVVLHRKQDEIIQGSYWNGHKGCAVGCTLHSSDHYSYETELGIPVQLAYIQDGLFERMRIGDARPFPEQFLQSIPVGVNLYPAYWRFMLFVLLDEKNGLITVTENTEVQDYIKRVGGLYQQALDGKEIEIKEWRDARAALAALDALDALAALDALDALDARAALDALDALDARAARAARALIWRDELLKCLSEAK